jgi:ABC-2 type transport system ATP-binding protein
VNGIDDSYVTAKRCGHRVRSSTVPWLTGGALSRITLCTEDTARCCHPEEAPGGFALARAMSQSVIEISQLTRRFGARTALHSVSLSLPRGAVYGLVGANGAGKTTLIKHILGLLRAESGSVRVFGLDPVADPVGVLSRIGYLSEENDIPGWMRVDELIRYSRAFYPRWDDAYAEQLRRTFALDGDAKIKTLSKGQKARAGLLIALAYRPELLVLDEPSSGLDPIVRRDILGAVIRTIADEGRTVLFSSHLLEEVEQVADHVTMISNGTIVLSASLDAIKESHRVDGHVPSLDEIFVARVGSPAISATQE